VTDGDAWDSHGARKEVESLRRCGMVAYSGIGSGKSGRRNQGRVHSAWVSMGMMSYVRWGVRVDREVKTRKRRRWDMMRGEWDLTRLWGPRVRVVHLLPCERDCGNRGQNIPHGGS
jgi:hypothetical protein